MIQKIKMVSLTWSKNKISPIMSSLVKIILTLRLIIHKNRVKSHRKDQDKSMNKILKIQNLRKDQARSFRLILRFKLKSNLIVRKG